MAQLTATEFRQLFEDKKVESESQREAYDKAEEYHLDKFGTERYNGWDVFRVIKHRYENK